MLIVNPVILLKKILPLMLGTVYSGYFRYWILYILAIVCGNTYNDERNI